MLVRHKGDHKWLPLQRNIRVQFMLYKNQPVTLATRPCTIDVSLVFFMATEPCIILQLKVMAAMLKLMAVVLDHHRNLVWDLLYYHRKTQGTTAISDEIKLSVPTRQFHTPKQLFFSLLSCFISVFSLRGQWRRGTPTGPFFTCLFPAFQMDQFF